MTDLHMERDFPITPDRLFDWLSPPENLVKWWGPEGLTIPEGDLDLSRTGPWNAVMQTHQGARYKLSGQVTHVERPRSVGFTWAQR